MGLLDQIHAVCPNSQPKTPNHEIISDNNIHSAQTHSQARHHDCNDIFMCSCQLEVEPLDILHLAADHNDNNINTTNTTSSQPRPNTPPLIHHADHASLFSPIRHWGIQDQAENDLGQQFDHQCAQYDQCNYTFHPSSTQKINHLKQKLKMAKVRHPDHPINPFWTCDDSIETQLTTPPIAILSHDHQTHQICQSDFLVDDTNNTVFTNSFVNSPSIHIGAYHSFKSSTSVAVLEQFDCSTMMENCTSLLIIDVRSNLMFEWEHIRGAINIPKPLEQDDATKRKIMSITSNYHQSDSQHSSLPEISTSSVTCFDTPEKPSLPFDTGLLPFGSPQFMAPTLLSINTDLYSPSSPPSPSQSLGNDRPSHDALHSWLTNASLEAKSAFAKRALYDAVVVYDHAASSLDRPYSPATELVLLLKKENLVPAVYLLKGGYSTFSTTFPSLTIGNQTMSNKRFRRKLRKRLGSYYKKFSSNETSRLLNTTRCPPSLILPYLYIGSERDACDLPTLQRLNITHILVIGQELKPHFPGTFIYKHFRVMDTNGENIDLIFPEACDFLNSVRKEADFQEGPVGGVATPSTTPVVPGDTISTTTLAPKARVLVHCFAGSSRSVTVTLAYLIYLNYTLKAAYDLVLEKRNIIHPNDGFMNQLASFDFRPRDTPAYGQQALASFSDQTPAPI